MRPKVGLSYEVNDFRLQGFVINWQKDCPLRCPMTFIDNSARDVPLRRPKICIFNGLRDFPIRGPKILICHESRDFLLRVPKLFIRKWSRCDPQRGPMTSQRMGGVCIPSQDLMMCISNASRVVSFGQPESCVSLVGQDLFRHVVQNVMIANRV